MTSHDVILEWRGGRRHAVTVGHGETVLEAALRGGVRLPYDCQKGTCTACVGRLLAVDGDDIDGGARSAVDYRHVPQALSERERADGYVLLCIATPRADWRVAVGPTIRAELGDGPWG